MKSFTKTTRTTRKYDADGKVTEETVEIVTSDGSIPDARIDQAAAEASAMADDMRQKMEEMFKGFDGLFKGMDSIFGSHRRKK